MRRTLSETVHQTAGPEPSPSDLTEKYQQQKSEFLADLERIANRLKSLKDSLRQAKTPAREQSIEKQMPLQLRRERTLQNRLLVVETLNNNTFTWSGPSEVLDCIGQRRLALAMGWRMSSTQIGVTVVTLCH
jgi:hypothetical protein